MTDDDRRRGATANQAGNGERGYANAKKFHANLTSCPFAKLRFNVVAAALGCGTARFRTQSAKPTFAAAHMILSFAFTMRSAT